MERGRPGHGLRHVLRAAGSDLHAVFAAGETLALVRPGRAAALVRRGAKLASQVDGLRRRHAQDNDCRVWVEDLPARLDQALRLLDGLAR